MRAMVLEGPGQAVQMRCLPRPQPGPDELLVKIAACAVCRTDLHVVDGELPDPKLPIIPGHEIIGRVVACGANVRNFSIGERVGIPWLGWTCGHCRYCRSGQENLCTTAKFTGYQINGGYAEYTVADARYCFRIPATYSDVEAAPLLCAGLIGYRALKMTEDAERVGIYGFGAAAHIVAQILVHQRRKLFAFTRPGIPWPRISPGGWVLHGQAIRTWPRPRNSMRLSFLHRQGRWCLPHCERFVRVGLSYAGVSI